MVSNVGSTQEKIEAPHGDPGHHKKSGATKRMTFHDHFSEVSDIYSAHRPTYPPALVDYLAAVTPARASVWEAGCGSGQLTALLPRCFESVVATDASAAQLAAAVPHEKVTYRVAREVVPWVADRSVDLVVVAQAAHWFDLAAFYGEVRRVAKPRAIVCLVAYARPQMRGAARAQAMIEDLHRRRLAAFWPEERAAVEAGYATLDFPFDEFAAPELQIERTWTAAEMLGYIETWSAYRAALRSPAAASFDRLAEEVTAAWGKGRAQVIWPLHLRIGHVGGAGCVST
ncbi:MAG TPA: class I SAM-dependent methyltransferase [Polyangiaceae bacterium]|nr:class I SAM-dependent methyltransferase [Polyangiaceae bacterium]